MLSMHRMEEHWMCTIYSRGGKKNPNLLVINYLQNIVVYFNKPVLLCWQRGFTMDLSVNRTPTIGIRKKSFLCHSARPVEHSKGRDGELCHKRSIVPHPCFKVRSALHPPSAIAWRFGSANWPWDHWCGCWIDGRLYLPPPSYSMFSTHPSFFKS